MYHLTIALSLGSLSNGPHSFSEAPALTLAHVIYNTPTQALPHTQSPPHSLSLTHHPQDVHQNGGYGSAGYGYSWKLADSQKNLLRTHTTAVSSRMLYRLAQDGFKPAKYFSIDRVFRNEAIDRTHLAEFHQVEGACLNYPPLPP